MQRSLLLARDYSLVLAEDWKPCVSLIHTRLFLLENRIATDKDGDE